MASPTPGGRRSVALLCGGGVLVVLALGWVIFEVLPDVFAPERSPGFGKSLEARARSDVRTSALQLLGGVVLAVGAVFTAWTVFLTRRRDQDQRAADVARSELEGQTQLTDRFTRAAEQLGHDAVAVRLGGIYGLARIARDSPDDHGPVMEVLVAYVREHAPWTPPPSPDDDPHPAVRAAFEADTGDPDPEEDIVEALDRHSPPPVAPTVDVQAALRFIAERDVSLDPPTFSLNFNFCDLRGARLQRAELERARLSHANLQGAYLVEACLESASLTFAQMDKARLVRARLEGADLSWAIGLDTATLTGATYDDRTKPPRGFDLESAGARRTDATKA